MSQATATFVSQAISVGFDPAKSASLKIAGLNGDNSSLPKSIDRCNSGSCLEICSAEEVGDLVDGDHSPWVRTEPDPHRFIVIRAQRFQECHVEWLQPMGAVWRETDDTHIVLPG